MRRESKPKLNVLLLLLLLPKKSLLKISKSVQLLGPFLGERPLKEIHPNETKEGNLQEIKQVNPEEIKQVNPEEVKEVSPEEIKEVILGEIKQVNPEELKQVKPETAKVVNPKEIMRVIPNKVLLLPLVLPRCRLPVTSADLDSISLKRMEKGPEVRRR